MTDSFTKQIDKNQKVPSLGAITPAQSNCYSNVMRKINQPELQIYLLYFLFGYCFLMSATQYNFESHFHMPVQYFRIVRIFTLIEYDSFYLLCK